MRMPGIVSVALVAVAGLGGVGACGGNDDSTPQRRIEVCVAAEGQRRDGDRTEVEFRQDGAVLAHGAIEVGGSFAAPVPADASVGIFVDGKPYGDSPASSGDTSFGCPAA
ncbi:hypothetical protein [Actinoplanes sp. URMC 104]|uniref:hypothetical protein n=1 Tax=Actinoplanes sp. URMC 104 TaxID=3423409 RepID=UPI003F1E36CC